MRGPFQANHNYPQPPTLRLPTRGSPTGQRRPQDLQGYRGRAVEKLLSVTDSVWTDALSSPPTAGRRGRPPEDWLWSHLKDYGVTTGDDPIEKGLVSGALKLRPSTKTSEALSLCIVPLSPSCLGLRRTLPPTRGRRGPREG